MTKEIKKVVKKAGLSLLPLGILFVLFALKATALSSGPIGGSLRLPSASKFSDTTTGQYTGRTTIGPFSSEYTATPTNLTHDPARPHTFAERGIPLAPTVQQLYSILREQGDRGYAIYPPQWVTRRGEQAQLTDTKLKLIWEQAKRIDLDPFYFLAILAQEGTGSFNTQGSIHGGQPHPNFEEDVELAALVIIREITEWRENGCPGDWLRWVNYGNGGEIYARGYAQDLSWWIKVSEIYNGRRLAVK